VLHTHERNKYTLCCASRVCYTEQIKVDSVSKMSDDAMYRAQGDRIGGV